MIDAVRTGKKSNLFYMFWYLVIFQILLYLKVSTKSKLIYTQLRKRIKSQTIH